MKKIRRDKNNKYWHRGEPIRKPNYNKHSKFVSYWKAMRYIKKRTDALRKYALLYL